MALRELFAERYSDSMRAIGTAATTASSLNPSHQVSVGQHVFRQSHRIELPLEDWWTLEYISIRRMQPLLEAIDDDASSFITVSEMNAFTSARPPTWRFAYYFSLSSQRNIDDDLIASLIGWHTGQSVGSFIPEFLSREERLTSRQDSHSRCSTTPNPSVT